MSRYFWSLLAFIGIAIWLVGSYTFPAPEEVVGVGWATLAPGWLLQGAALLCLFLFVGVQGWLLWSTFALRSLLAAPPTTSRFHLRLRTELFWTLLPLIATLGLAWLGYQTWVSVPTV